MLTNNWDFIIKHAGFTPDAFTRISGEIREAYNNMIKAFEIESNLAYARHGAGSVPTSAEIEKAMFPSFWNWLIGRQDITGLNQASLLFLYAMKDEDGAYFDGNIYVEATNVRETADPRMPVCLIQNCPFRKEVQENGKSFRKHTYSGTVKSSRQSKQFQQRSSFGSGQ